MESSSENPEIVVAENEDVEKNSSPSPIEEGVVYSHEEDNAASLSIGEADVEAVAVEEKPEDAGDELFVYPGPLRYFGQLHGVIIKTLIQLLKGWKNLIMIFIVALVVLSVLVFFQFIIIIAFEEEVDAVENPPTGPWFMTHSGNVNADKPPVFWTRLSSVSSSVAASLVANWKTPFFSTFPEDTIENIITPGFPLIPHTVEKSSVDNLESDLYGRFNEEDDVYGAFALNKVSSTSFEYDQYYNKTLGLTLITWEPVETTNLPGFVDSLHAANFAAMKGLANATLSTTSKTFPVEKYISTFDIAGWIGDFYFTIVFTLLFPFFMVNIVSEKEFMLTTLMRMNGLNMSAYWIVMYIVDYIIYIAMIVLVICFCILFQLRFLTQNNPVIYMLIFFVWGHYVVSGSFLCSVFFSKQRSASVFGYLFVFAGAIGCYTINGLLLGNADTDGIVLFVSSFFPLLSFHRAISYLFRASYDKGRGITLEEVFNLELFQRPPWELTGPSTMMWLIFVIVAATFVNLILFAYLQSVVPSGDGTKPHPLFFIRTPILKIIELAKGKQTEEVAIDPSFREDVQEEIRAAMSGESIVSVQGISRKFSSSIIPERLREMAREKIGVNNFTEEFFPLDNRAVNDLSFTVRTGECFGLLGPNGSGKTTTLNMISGIEAPTDGTAKIDGFDIVKNSNSVKNTIGMCPQYDYLWPELTAQEHLMFFGRIRGLHGGTLRRQVKKTLDKVNLGFATKKRAGMYSGGMKRRLSLAIALISNPDVILLDEPTTGLDPGSRRDVWEVILKILGDKNAVVLTTHSMPEAEYLCGRVGIVEKGRLQCVGTQAELKKKYADGYNILITTSEHNESRSKEELEKLIPGVVATTSLNGTAHYFAPKESVKVSTFYNHMSQNASELGITDWSISPSSLEEVFDSVTYNKDAVEI